MANVTAKTSSNIFYKARCEAATHNEQLSSREGAADYMSIDRGRLYRIESGIAIPYPEEIRLMQCQQRNQSQQPDKSRKW